MRDFLEFIQATDAGYVEVRSIREGRVRQWWERDRQAAVDLAIAQSDEGWDAYYGVLPRTDMAGDAEHVSSMTPVLWADLDAKHGVSKQFSLLKITRYPIAPSVVVDSGHGYHVYWRLQHPVLFDEAKPAMVGLARQLGGDHVYDKPRILRIPGTTNWKDPEKPRPVRTIVFDTTNLHRLGDFHDATRVGLEDLQPAPRPRQRQFLTPRQAQTVAELPQWLRELIATGAPQGQRSEAAWKVMCNLIERGFSDEQIRQVFEAGGIGDKMREMRDGDRWFRRSLERARLSCG